jgi:uncharacterized protein (TIGR00730 family)
LLSKIQKDLIRRMKESRSYLRAYEDVEFLKREDLRAVRLQLELLKPELLLREAGITSTIVVFGSTRTVSRPESLRSVLQIEAALRRQPKSRRLLEKLSIARRLLAKSNFYDEAREFARLVSADCQRRGKSEYVIVTGGGPGIMEAANRGAHDIGAKTIGLNITLPHEQYPNPYITPSLSFQFHYFALRKMHFMMRAKAMVIFPGGYGTLDELFEALTLVQTGKVESLPVILVGKEWWKRLIDWEFLRDEGVIAAEDLDLFRFVDSGREAWKKIQEYYRARRGLVLAGRRGARQAARTRRARAAGSRQA